MIEVFLLWAFVASIDGDTLTLREGAETIHVRLAEIDAPERTQPYSHVSRKNLDTLCRGKSVEIRKVDIDRYSRTVAHVWCDDLHVNWRQVEDGLAWCFTKYLKQPELCLPLEKMARESRKGLWRELNPQPPWEFRAANKRQ